VESNQSGNNKYISVLTTGLWGKNPSFVLLMGLCPMLAVTFALKPALTMGLCFIFVLLCCSFILIIMPDFKNKLFGIFIFIIFAAAFVTIADLYVRAFYPAISKALGIYLPLIIANCIILSHAQIYISSSNRLSAILAGLCIGIGFTIALCILAAIREIFSSGALFGIAVLPAKYPHLSAVQLPAGAFITLGLLLALLNFVSKRKGG
jgi:electron transport complex protein RnfE